MLSDRSSGGANTEDTLVATACIGLYTACGDDDVGESLARLATTAGQGAATVAVAGYLVKEWLCDGEQGKLGPYLSMLPWDAAWPPWQC